MNYHIAQVRYALGDKRNSITAMEQADRVRDAVYRRARVRHLGALAERKLEIGHLEEACSDWSRTLDDPAVQSGRCDNRFDTMMKSLKPHRRNPHAKALYERCLRTTVVDGPGAGYSGGTRSRSMGRPDG
ncbi:hypothetical protein [Actinomadura sp. KC345]|uniref:hypothetical protein n=1 Tax=Actinomadura sp. KC345 TaxID=2530371 RepID=UPI001A9F8A74|nr:hypothetical protein [Actinomadura sp. KC345]